MICSKCGAQVPENSRFCPVCGAPAEAPAQPQAAPDLFSTPSYTKVESTSVPVNTATKAPAGSLGGFKLPDNMMELIFPAATVLLSILTLIFWCTGKFKGIYKYEGKKETTTISFKKVCEGYDLEALNVIILVFVILLVVALIGICALQVLGIGNKKMLQYAGIACAALLFILMILFVIIVKSKYNSTMKEYKEMLMEFYDDKKKVKEILNRTKFKLGGTGVMAILCTLFAGGAQAAGAFLAPSKD